MSAFWHCCKLSCSDCKKNITTLLQIHFHTWQEQNHDIRAGAFFKGPQRLSHSILLQIALYWWQEHQDAADCFVLMGRIIWWLLQIHLHWWQEQNDVIRAGSLFKETERRDLRRGCKFSCIDGKNNIISLLQMHLYWCQPFDIAANCPVVIARRI